MNLFGRDADDDPIRVMFMCVENAGRSQLSAAIAERERERRDLSDRVEICSAGTHPADEIDPVVVDVMEAEGFEFSNRSPTLVQIEELKSVDYLVTMGCYVQEFDPASFGVNYREWDLRDPAGRDPETVREIRGEVEARVSALFDELTATEESN